MKNKFFALIVILLLSINHSFSQLTLTSAAPSQITLQNNLLGAGIVVNNITYTGVPNSLATFSGTSSIGISNGLYIGTGTSAQVGSTAAYFHSDGASGPGDSDLQTIATGTTQDAGVLEFDFKVQGDSVKFNFVFASEEYSDYANTGFNDVFAFFISGPGITGNQNIAIVPGTALPVTINNVNNGNSPVGVVPTGPCMNCAYYNDNTNGTSCAFDGMTTVLTAISAVQPCTFYHIKLAVANVNDGAFDSGIFLEANSFTYCGPLSVFNGLAPIQDTIDMCNGGSLTLTSCKGPNYSWSTGDTTQSITITQPGNYFVTVSEGSCTAVSSQIVVVADTNFNKPQVLQNANVLSSSIVNAVYNYEWFKDGISIPNSNTPNIQIGSGGCYKVKISNAAGCNEISDSLCLAFAGINENKNEAFTFTVFPNPSHENVKISFANDAHDLIQLRVTDVSGKLMIMTESKSNLIILMHHRLQPGIYFIEMENLKTNLKARSKFVVE